MTARGKIGLDPLIHVFFFHPVLSGAVMQVAKIENNEASDFFGGYSPTCTTHPIANPIIVPVTFGLDRVNRGSAPDVYYNSSTYIRTCTLVKDATRNAKQRRVILGR